MQNLLSVNGVFLGPSWFTIGMLFAALLPFNFGTLPHIVQEQMKMCIVPAVLLPCQHLSPENSWKTIIVLQ